MVEAIAEAKHYVYIENQFFITSTKSEDTSDLLFSNSIEDIVKNQIGTALLKRIVQAHKANEKFRVYVLLPLLPGFEGDVGSESTGNLLRTILHFNYASICRGPNSLFKQLSKHGINPSNYISFCSLRQKGQLLGTQITELIYIHSKLMIVDDRLVICGSANINDRSLLGYRDSEVN